MENDYTTFGIKTMRKYLNYFFIVKNSIRKLFYEKRVHVIIFRFENIMPLKGLNGKNMSLPLLSSP